MNKNNFQLFHHIMLALTAIFYAASTSLQLFNHWPSVPLILFLGAGTILAYRIATWRPLISLFPFQFGFQSGYNKIIFYVLLLIVLVSLVQLPKNSVIGTLIMGTLTALYFSQWKSKEKLQSGLRSVPLIKNILLASIWAAATVWFPSHEKGFATGELYLFMSRFIYILAICFAVDLRDLENDRSQKTNTLPVIYGYNKIKSLCIILLLIFIALTFFRSSFVRVPYRNSYEEYVLISSAVLTIVCLLSLKKNDSYNYYTLLLDGNMFLQSFMLIV